MKDKFHRREVIEHLLHTGYFTGAPELHSDLGVLAAWSPGEETEWTQRQKQSIITYTESNREQY